VPVGGPPTFGGRLVKYSYKLAVGAQKPGSQTQIFRIPFRVLTIPGKFTSVGHFAQPLFIVLLVTENLYRAYLVPSPKQTNPFLMSEKKEDPTLEIALQALAIETSKKTASKIIMSPQYTLIFELHSELYTEELPWCSREGLAVQVIL